MLTELREALTPLSMVEMELFNAATKNCTEERKLRVLKRMEAEKLPKDWRFTENQIRKFVAEDGLSEANANYYVSHGAKINEGNNSGLQETTKPIKESGDLGIEQNKTYKMLRLMKFSEADAKKLVGQGFKF